MRYQSIKRITGLAAIVAALAWPSAVRADDLVVASGWDLLLTVDAELKNPGLPGPDFLDFKGVPLGTYDFKGSIGVQNVGNSDTIIHRLDTATIPPSGSDTIGIQVDALQLIDTSDGYYATLNPNTASTGNLTIFDDGTWSNDFYVYFDLYAGASANPAYYLGNGNKHFIGSGNWTHYPGTGDPLITGVNSLLNGSDHLNDFFLVGQAVHDAGDGSFHIVISPEPSSALLAVLGTGLWLMRRKLLQR